MKSLLIGWTLILGAAMGAGNDFFGTLYVEPARSDAPAVILRPMTAVPLVAVRLSVELQERPGHDGAIAVLQELAREGLEPRAGRLGARLRLERTPTHAVYEIVGPAESFPDFVQMLREAVSRAGADARDVDRAWNTYRTRALVELETPEPFVRRRLREGLFPELAPTRGDNDGSGLSPAALEWFWSASYRPERMSAVVVGPIDPQAARSAFREWAVPPSPAGPPPRGAQPALPEEEALAERGAAAPEPQILFAWAGLGFPAGGVEAAPAVLAARIVEQRLRADGVDSPRAELWWAGERRALVVLGSARPGSPGQDGRDSDAAELRDRLRRVLDQTAALLTADDVAAARAELQREFLMAARSPAGLARLIGTFLDRSGEPDAARRFWTSLPEMDATQVRGTLLIMLANAEVAVEVRP